MRQVKEGDAVLIDYTGKLEDGTIFDSTEGNHPLEFTVGKGEVIPGFEKGVIGMSAGESKVISVPPEEGYGPHLKERVCSLDKRRIPDGFHPEVGQQIQMYRADGLPVMGKVVGVSETALTMDYNHPLAGKTLIFETRLVEILED